ncbi:MAG: serine/threonine-protein phosphatase [Elusimicrobia bacterium]|nr:serine/threonine-protein phosphatase [Elusimicrobiota bacterium]
MIILSSAQTNTGRVRTENQDCFGADRENNFFFVCDGMGGGVAGDFASNAAVDTILSSYSKINKQDCLDILGEEYNTFEEKVLKPIALIKMANRYLYGLTKKYPKLSGMGTTCAGVWLDKDTNLIHIYNVGDSRVYRIRSGKIQLLTEDHSKIQELIDCGKMTKEDAKMAEIQSMITRALGIGKTVKVDYKSEIFKNGDIYILCTDGLNGELSNFTINDIVSLHKPDVNAITKELITAANNAGGRDNTTVISICVQDDGLDVQVNTEVEPVSDIMTFSDESKTGSDKEQSLIRKFEKRFSVAVPKSAKNKNLLRSPLFIAILLVLLVIAGVFVYTALFKDSGEQKSIVELTGNISGIKLEIMTITASKLEEIKNTTDKVFKIQLIQECFANASENFTPMQNVTISLDSDGQNKYMGMSSFKAVEIKLPKGNYEMTLSYPGYKILDKNLKLQDTIDVTLEASDELSKMLIVMVPEEDFQKE